MKREGGEFLYKFDIILLQWPIQNLAFKVILLICCQVFRWLCQCESSGHWGKGMPPKGAEGAVTSLLEADV